MKVQFNIVGQMESVDVPDVDLAGVPREGDQVFVNALNHELTVRTVVWFPWGDDDGTSETPFVYVVLGNPRP